MSEFVTIRIGKARRIRQVAVDGPRPLTGARLVVRTERGTEMAIVLDGAVTEAVAARSALENEMCLGPERFWEVISAGEPPAPAVAPSQHAPPEKPAEEVALIGEASAEDLEKLARLRQVVEEGEFEFFKQKIVEQGLPMKPVAVEHLFGGEKILFYFTSESRVDFRRLVRVLVTRYRTRIELRRVNPREAAALSGGVGVCGLETCCHRWLEGLVPVSIKMARTQNRPIASDANLGMCSRLRCCLRYELTNYEDPACCRRREG